MPTLDRLQERLGGDGSEVDRAGPSVIRKFFDEIEVRLPVLVDQDVAAIHALGLFDLPATLFIGPEENEFGRLDGPAEWDSPEMAAFLQGSIERLRLDWLNGAQP